MRNYSSFQTNAVGTQFSFESEIEFIPQALQDVDIVQKLSNLEVDIIHVILENCVDKLLILAASKPKTSHKLHYPKIVHRFLSETSESLYDRETHMLVEDTHDYRRVLKLQKDRDLLVKLLEMTIEEMSNTRTTVGLAEFVQEESKQEDGVAKLLAEYKANKETLANLQSLQESERAKYKQQLLQKKIQLKEHQNVGEEAIFSSGVEIMYYKNWEESRVEQNTIMYELEEKKLKDEFDNNSEAMRMDNVVHDAMVKYLEYSKMDLTAQLEFWTEIYNEEIEAMDIEITTYKANIDEMKKKFVQMEKVFSQRQDEINAYLEERGEREKMAQAKQHLEDCATRIQAWWRGTMVRRHLGPYKKSKKKGKKKGKKTPKK